MKSVLITGGNGYIARGINTDGKIIPGELTYMNMKVVDL